MGLSPISLRFTSQRNKPYACPPSGTCALPR
nr:MAG TPA: hypothetical protein [Caudoviricetes sp.]